MAEPGKQRSGMTMREAVRVLSDETRRQKESIGKPIRCRPQPADWQRDSSKSK